MNENAIKEFGDHNDRIARRFWLWLATFLVLVFCAIGIASCSRGTAYSTPPTMAQAPAAIVQPMIAAQAPVVVQQQPSGDGFFTGLMVGHLLSGSSHTYVQAAPARSTTVINKTVINKTVVAPQGPPAPQYAMPKPAPYAPRAAATYSAPRSYSYSAPRTTYGGSAFRSSRR